MGQRRSKNRKAKTSLKSSRDNGSCQSSESTNALERFLFPLALFQWFSKKREPDCEADTDEVSSVSRELEEFYSSTSTIYHVNQIKSPG